MIKATSDRIQNRANVLATVPALKVRKFFVMAWCVVSLIWAKMSLEVSLYVSGISLNPKASRRAARFAFKREFVRLSNVVGSYHFATVKRNAH